jgi:hypothetical protein
MLNAQVQLMCCNIAEPVGPRSVRRQDLFGRFGPNRTGIGVIAEQVGAAMAVRGVGLDAPDTKCSAVFELLNEERIVEELPDQIQRWLVAALAFKIAEAAVW